MVTLTITTRDFIANSFTVKCHLETCPLLRYRDSDLDRVREQDLSKWHLIAVMVFTKIPIPSVC